MFFFDRLKEELNRFIRLYSQKPGDNIQLSQEKSSTNVCHQDKNLTLKPPDNGVLSTSFQNQSSCGLSSKLSRSSSSSGYLSSSNIQQELIFSDRFSHPSFTKDENALDLKGPNLRGTEPLHSVPVMRFPFSNRNSSKFLSINGKHQRFAKGVHSNSCFPLLESVSSMHSSLKTRHKSFLQSPKSVNAMEGNYTLSFCNEMQRQQKEPSTLMVQVRLLLK